MKKLLFGIALLFSAKCCWAGATTVSTTTTASIVSHSTFTVQRATISVPLGRIDNLVTSMINGSTGVASGFAANVKQFGAKGDGSTDDTAAIQAAADAIVNSGKPGVLSFDPGTYVCSSTLTINMGYVSIMGNGAVLNFATAIIANDFVAVHITGAGLYSGTPWFQAQAFIKSLRIQGPSKDYKKGTGMYFFSGGSSTGPAHVGFYDMVVEGFKHGVRFGSNSYLIDFYHTNLFDNVTSYYSPTTNIDGTTATNVGEKFGFHGGTIFASSCAFFNENGSADFQFTNTSFDYNASTSVVMTAGQASFTGCHFESLSKAVYITGNTYATFNAPYFLVVGDQDKPVYNGGFMTINGGRLVCSNSSTNCLYSDNRINVIGMHFQTASTTPYTLSNKYIIYPPNDGTFYTSGELNASDIKTPDVRISTAFVASTYVGLASTITASKIIYLPVTTPSIGNALRVTNVVGSSWYTDWTDVTVSSSTGANTNYPTSAQFGDGAALTLQPGAYNLTACILQIANGATVVYNDIGISVTSGNSSSGLTGGLNYFTMPPALATYDSGACAVSEYSVTPAVATTYYAKIRAQYSVATPQYRCRLTAVPR